MQRRHLIRGLWPYSLFKNNSHFIVFRNWRRFVVCNRDDYSADMQSLVINPDQAFAGKLLKADPTTTLAIYQLNDKTLVVKRYNIKGFWHGLKRCISPTRAVKCWRNAHHLLALNIATPKPIAIIEKRFGPLRQQAYFIYEFVSGAIGSDIFTTRSTQQENFSPLAEKVIYLIKQILDANLSHGDLKTANFIFCEDQVFLIDLDALRLHFLPFMHRRAKAKNIQRFLANWPDDPALQNLMQKKVTEILLNSPGLSVTIIQ